MTDQYVVPPEFQIRETQVIEQEIPNPDTFYPNNQGQRGWSPLPPALERKVQMDPIMRYGQDPSAAAAQSGAEAIQDLMRQTGINQINTTRVTEHEGGSYVHYHEPTRDDQISSVGGRAISGDPQTVSDALMIGDKGVQREATADAYKAKELLSREAMGMNDGTRAALLEVIHQKGGEALESVSTGIGEALGTRIIRATDSGVPLHAGLQGKNPALVELQAIMKYHGERQRKGAAKPMATHHPSESNYQSRHGAFGNLDFSSGVSASVSSAAGAASSITNLASSGSSSPASSSFLPSRETISQSGSIASYMQTPLVTSVVPTKTGMTQSRLPARPASMLTTLFAPTPGPTSKTAPSIRRTDVPAPTAGNGDEDSRAIVDPGTGIPYYEMPPETTIGEAPMSNKVKIAIAAAAGIGLILLLRG